MSVVNSGRIYWNIACVAIAALIASQAGAHPFRVSLIPNGGGQFSCGACHVVQSGGGPRNSFGQRVESLLPTLGESFWTPVLAAEDSDNDGFTNGQELGDPDGDFANVGSSSLVTNPGNAASKPNSAPNFTSSPVLTAAIGTAYSYTATVTDPDLNSVTFSKSAGPSWLNVAANGAVTGTPLEAHTGSVSVTIQATDNGSPAATRDQTYTLVVRATFAGWQNLRFTLPAENTLASASADPDGDGVPNLIEYALRTNPKVNDSPPKPVMSFNGNGQAVFTLAVRDDAPGLSAAAEISSVLPFTSITTASGVLTDPTPGDGFKTATFTDTVSKDSATARFTRFKVTASE
jgi:hypothetical protein